MTLPLYSNSGAPNEFNRVQNAGLWYDKFCNKWRQEKGYWTLQAGHGNRTDPPKLQWIKTLAGKNTGDTSLISEMVNRRAAMVYALGGQLRVFATDWRFVTGLGREHPVENGFAWHHTLGTAYLPGSSVKGLVRAWAREGEEDETNKEAIDRIFGPANGKKQAGSIIFFDALPLSPVQLEADVMTPHYSQYYKKDNHNLPPGDWMSPEPIQFLTVAEGQEFLFALAPRRPDDEGDVELAATWLEAALAWLGAGAKTAAGYGRFSRQGEKEEKLLKKQQKEKERAAQEARLMEMSPLRREMEEDGYSSAGFMEKLTNKWLGRMEDKDAPAEEKAEIARLLMEWYENYNSDQWKKPNKKNQKKISRIKKILGE
jgi:CRISPR-associated protein Cmr6